MSVPRVLLLTGTPPGKVSAGGIFLHDLCLYYPRGSICCYAVVSPNHYVPSPDLDWLPITHGRPPREAGFRRLGCYFARLSSFPIQQYVKHVQTSALIEQAVEFGKQQGVGMVWAVFDKATLIYMAREVAVALGAQLVTLVWDAPEYLAMRLSFDWLSCRSLLREFEDALRVAVRCGVISEEMQDEYETRYGVESVILRYGIHQDKRRPPAKGPNEGKQFVIGFAGSLHDEWQPLLSALSKIDWRIDGRDISFRLMGPNHDFHFRPPRHQGKMHIEYLGCLPSVDEVIELMSQVDVAYLPYQFDESYRALVRLSFPSKLTTYLTAGRPVLFHGPEDSSPARFFRRFPVGLCCHSLEESKIIECLHRFATDREFYASATQAGQVALNQELDLRVFLRRFAMLIGIEEGELLPI